MPVNELIPTQMDPNMAAQIIGNLNTVIAWLQPYSTNLTAEERQRFGSINEQNKLLVNKVSDYRNAQPTLSSPDVNWTLYQQNLSSRNSFAMIEQLLSQLQEMCSDPRILHDYSLYQNALVDYDYTKYKANSTAGGAGFTSKYDDVKQLFPNPSGNNGGNTPRQPVKQPVGQKTQSTPKRSAFFMPCIT
ncbi:hypothetical protein ACTHGU_05265 [Chitinophagaceae bacterium MMS25-I14]